MLCAIWLIGVPAGLLLGAVIVRLAVVIANATIDLKRSRFDQDATNTNEDDVEAYLRRLRSSRPIPKPSFGQSMMIVFVASLFNFGFYLLIGFLSFVSIGGRWGQVVILILSLPGSFAVMSALLTQLLPTSFGRACWVALFYNLIVMILGVALLLILLGIAFVQGQGL